MDEVTIGISNGVFDEDQALAVALYRLSYPQCKTRIIRTKSEKKLEPCKITIGFDSEFQTVPGPYSIAVAFKLFEEFDGIVELAQSTLQENGPLSFVKSLNADWDVGTFGKEQDNNFELAVDMVEVIAERIIKREKLQRFGKEIMMKKLKESNEKTVIDLGQYIGNWQEYVCKENNIREEGTKIRACVYGSKGNTWKLQMVPVTVESAETFALIDAEKCKDIPGFIFCKKSGHIAGFKTHEGALQAASMLRSA